MKLIRIVLVSFLSSSLMFMPVVYAAELALPSGDLVAPVIKHTPIGKDIPPGQAVDVKATITDNVGVKEAILFYRVIDTNDFKRMRMKRDLDSDTYAAKLPTITAPGVEYYIQATDLAGNTLLYGHSFSPLTITVAPVAIDDGDTKEAVAATEFAPIEEGKEEKSGISKWVWVGLGVVAVAALAGGGGGGGGGSTPGDSSPNTGTVTINGPVP